MTMNSSELRERWLTSSGAKVREALIREIRSSCEWQPILENFPGAADTKNCLDLRGVNFSGLDLSKIALAGAALDFAIFDRCTAVNAFFDHCSMPFASFDGVRIGGIGE